MDDREVIHLSVLYSLSGPRSYSTKFSGLIANLPSNPVKTLKGVIATLMIFTHKTHEARSTRLVPSN